MHAQLRYNGGLLVILYKEEWFAKRETLSDFGYCPLSTKKLTSPKKQEAPKSCIGLDTGYIEVDWQLFGRYSQVIDTRICQNLYALSPTLEICSKVNYIGKSPTVK